MKIYTKTGDDGTTGLFGAPRVGKDDPRIEAYGAVDELNATLGVARATGLPGDIETVVTAVQHDLFTLGADLANPHGKGANPPTLAESDITGLEQAIDLFESRLAPLTQFILPAGTPAAAQLHHARTVCRRAERRVIALSHREHEPVRPETVIYLNRLSDLLFVLARAANAAAGQGDVPWVQ